MRRALTRAARALVAAGALGLTQPAVGQQGPAPAFPGGHSVVTGEEAVPTLSRGQARLEEMKIEMAWMADPVTFGCRLDARCSGAGVIARGYVPNEAVKEHALLVAQKASLLPVEDGLKVHPSLALRSAGGPAEALQKGAMETLTARLGPRIHDLSVKAQLNGQVTVTGSVASVEEKLQVSRLLRQVQGCTSVANHLAVSSVERDGGRVTFITADESLHLPGGIPGLDESNPEGADALPLEAPFPRVAVPEIRLPPPAPVPARKTGNVQEKYREMPQAPQRPLPGDGEEEEDEYLPRLLPTRKYPESSKAGGIDILTAPRMPPQWSGQSPPTPTPPAGYQIPPSVPVAPPPSPGSTGVWTLDMAASRLASINRSELVRPRTAPPYTALTPPAGETGHSEPTVSRGPSPGGQTRQAVHETTGEILFDDERVAAPASARPSVRPGPGEILFDDEGMADSGNKRAAIVPARLERQVKTACGTQARAVEVTALRDGTVLVRVRVNSPATQKPLFQKIMQLPEMAAPEVHLELRVEP